MSDPKDTHQFICEVGKRRRAPEGTTPTAEVRAVMNRMARYLTRAPKGVFIYSSHEAANLDREKWIVEAIVSRAI